MNMSDKLIAGIRMDAPQVRTHDEIRAIAKSTQLHPFSCKCEGCLVYNEAMAGVNSTKSTATPNPPVSTKLGASFKAILHDSGARAKPSGSTVEDESGRGKPKKSKRVSEKLAASLTALLK